MELNSRNKLIEYFRKNLKKGYTLDSLKIALVKQGYSKGLIESSFKDFENELVEKAPILKDKPRISYEIVDERNKTIELKKSLWKRFLDLWR